MKTQIHSAGDRFDPDPDRHLRCSKGMGEDGSVAGKSGEIRFCSFCI